MKDLVIEKRQLTTKPRWEAWKDYRSMQRVLSIYFVVFVILTLVHPALGMVVLTHIIVKWLKFLEYYDNEERKNFYKILFAPMMDAKHLVQIGYEVYPHEYTAHLGIVEDGKKLGQKAKVMKKDRLRQVGVSKAVLTTHIWGIGKTGAGKTSFAVTLMRKAMESSCGIIYVDGKGELKNAHWLYALALEQGREHEFYVVNYREPTKSNKFNPIEGLPPEALSEFFFSLMPQASGDQSYWQGRGKSLFRPIAYFYYFRWRFWGESFTVETLSSSLDKVNFSFLSVVTFALITAYNRKLSSDPRVAPFIKEAKRYRTPRSPFAAVELLSSYFTQMPQASIRFESYGYSKEFLDLLYKTYNFVEGYTSSVASAWKEAHEKFGRLLVDYAASRGIDIMRLEIIELRHLYSELKSAITKQMDEKLASMLSEAGVSAEDPRALQQFIQNLELNVSRAQGGGDPVQHQYAQQQWDDIISTINDYGAIFKPLVSDFTIPDIVRNGKILFFIFPAMDKSQSTMKMLARLLLRTITDAVAQSLGKDFEVTRTQREIIENIVKPKPLCMLILDEYGSYSTPGVETLAAQIRSLNFSLIILTQDYVSAKVDNSELEAERLWANTSKLIFKVQDLTTIRKVQDMLEEITVSKEAGGVDVGGTTESEHTKQFMRESSFDAKELAKFANGFCLVLGTTRPFLLQTYYSPQDEYMEGAKSVYSLIKLKAV